MAFRQRGPLAASPLHRLTPLILVVVLAFYIWQTNNYGGWTSGPRWLFWLTPLLLLALVPAVDRLAASRAGRGFAYLCLGVSAFSAAYPWTNPWRHAVDLFVGRVHGVGAVLMVRPDRPVVP